MVAGGNTSKIMQVVFTTLKIYSKVYSSQCKNEPIIAVHWKWYKTPITVW